MITNFYSKENKKNRVFPIRISQLEKEFLKSEAKKQAKSIAELIREGYLTKFNV